MRFKTMLAVLFVFAVGEIHAGDVEAGANHLGEDVD